MFTVSGDGTWQMVPGSTGLRGQGREVTYTVEVEEGATVSEGDRGFAAAVDSALSDPQSWIGSGHAALRRIDSIRPISGSA